MVTQADKKTNSLRSQLCSKSGLNILRDYFQENTTGLLGEAVLVTVHRVWALHPPHDLTELGITTYRRRKHGQGSLESPGPHAENIVNRIWSFHLRIRSHAHLPTALNHASAYHFGTTIYVSKAEALDMLHQIWHQPINETDLSKGMHPILYMHFGNNDSIGRMRKAQFDFDPLSIPTNIASLDAQNIPTQAKITRQSDATLDYLLPQFKIEPFHLENGGNAAMYTSIVAILSALRKELYKSTINPLAVPGRYGISSSNSAQSMMQWLMEWPTPAPPFGFDTYCTQCGCTTHEVIDCTNTDLTCGKCENSPLIWRQKQAGSHISGLCTFR